MLSPSPQGPPLAVAALRALKETGLELIAVVRPDDRRLTDMLEAEGARTVACPQAGQGMGHSIACGVAASPGVQGWLIVLGDMPSIQRRTIQVLLAALSEGALLVVPEYHGRRGHPVGLSGLYRNELLGLSGDRGARSILERHHAHLRRIPVIDPGILIDIDRPMSIAPNA